MTRCAVVMARGPDFDAHYSLSLDHGCRGRGDRLPRHRRDLLAAGLPAADGGCDRCKALFCATEDGRSAIVRQLSPAVHLDTSPKVLLYLAPHLQRVVHVPPSAVPAAEAPAGVASARSLAEYEAQSSPDAPAAGPSA